LVLTVIKFGCFSRTDFHTRVSFRIYRETLSRFSCAASPETLRLGINRHTADIPTTVHQCGPRGQAAFLAVGGIGSVNSV
ncbi:hypothetical protein ABLN64_14155, partial [Mycobacterium tuberculosis]